MAQQSNSITLSCNGTNILTAVSAADVKPDPITKLGVIVDFATKQVHFMDYKVPITDVTPTLVSFRGRLQPEVFGTKLKPFTVDGSIDRVTGQTTIGWYYENTGNNSSWDLMCVPSTRLF
jgi:hypothetical protein